MLGLFRKKDKKIKMKEAKGINKKELQRNVSMELVNMMSIYPDVPTIDISIIEKMIRYLDISTSVLSIQRGVCSRDIKLSNRTNIEDDKDLIDIRGRFNKIEGWNDFLRELSLTPYYGFSVFEKIYNEDFSLKKLQFIPRQLIRYERYQRTWHIGNDRMEIDDSKFLIARYGETMEYPQGNSLFNYGLHQAWKDHESLEAKVRGLQEKYGAVIAVYSYDPDEADTDEGKEKIRERGKLLKEMTDKNAMAIPMDSDNKLKDQFTFISLADLKPDMQKIFLERLERKIEKFVKGSTFSDGGQTGSFSKDKVQQGEKEKIEDDIATFMSEQMQEIVKSDSLFFGYDPSEYRWIFELEEGEGYKEDLEGKKATTKTEKIKSFVEAKNLGYQVKKEVVADTLGIKAEDLEEVEPPTIPTPGIGSEFAASKKKIELYIERTLRNEESFSKLIKDNKAIFTKEVNRQALEQFKKMKTVKDIKKGFKYNLQDFQDKMIIASLYGVLDELEMEQLGEFAEEEFDPFNLPFDEAIAAFIEREPVMYDVIEPITEVIRERFTWIKYSTELETTKSLMENLAKNIESGGTLKEWIKDSAGILKKTGFGENGWYLELVYRNNQHSAYNAGQFYQQEENSVNKPYAMYMGIDDNRQTDLCSSLDGLVYALSHPFWQRFMPPNHHGCRSRRVAVSKEDMKEYGVKEMKVEPQDLEELKGYDKKWIGNPAKGIKATIKQKEKDIDKLYDQLKGV